MAKDRNQRLDSANGDKDASERILSKSSSSSLIIAFGMLFIPMLAVPLILLAFVKYSGFHQEFKENGTPELPVDLSNVTAYYYYTTISVQHIATVSGWAGTAGQFIMAPFMFLFSFLVAKGLVDDMRDVPSATITDVQVEYGNEYELLQGLAKAAWQDTLKGVGRFCSHLIFRDDKISRRHAVKTATIGAAMSGALTLLLIAGDNLLKLTIQPIQQTVYLPILRSNGTNYYDEHTNANFFATENCSSTINMPLDPSGLTAPQPCSLNTTLRIWNLQRSVSVFSTLYLGISDAELDNSDDSVGMNEDNSEALQIKLLLGTGTDIQIFSYIDDKNLSHAFLFNVTAAGGGFHAPSNISQSSDASNLGIDFTAQTYSMVTECQSATQACQLRNVSQATNSNNSIPFNCSSIFSGDLFQIPSNGIERFSGWNASFYETKDGKASDILVPSQMNPFYFNATAAVSSIDFSVLKDVHDEQVPNGEVVDAGAGRVAFALNCKSTIYDVSYSLINGNITNWNAKPSDPRVASIIKAPLQVGLGRFKLYEDASLAILLNQETVAKRMGLSFSRVGMALASGAFRADKSNTQRQRYDMRLTGVYQPALWFLVMICLIYAALGLGILIAAFALRKKSDYSRMQCELMRTEPWGIVPGLRELLSNCWEKVKDLVNKN